MAEQVRENPRHKFGWNPRLSFAVLLVAGWGVWAYWQTLGAIVTTWSDDPDYSHGYLVVPLALLFLWLRRTACPTIRLGFHPSGLVLLVAAALIRHIAARYYLPELDAWTVPLWIGGVCWSLFGWPFFYWILPSVAFLCFAVPLPATLATALSVPLQQLAARCSGISLQLLGQPAITEGTTILLNDQTLDIEKACSGLRMFYGITALAFAIILILRPGRWRSIAMLLAIAPVAILVNVLRITATGLLTTYFPGDVARRRFHDLAGAIVIPLAVLGFLSLLWLANRLTASWREDSRRASRWLLGTFIAGLSAAAIGLWLYGVQQERVFDTLLAVAAKYEQDGDWASAAEYLSRYTLVHPEDLPQRTHLAEAFARSAATPAAKLRAAMLLQDAYQAAPERRDLAITAIDLASETESYPVALNLINDLSKSSGTKSDDQLVKKWADVLLAYLSSAPGSRQTKYTWADVAKAMEAAVALKGYETRHAVALALVNRQKLLVPAEAERFLRADNLINQLVIDRSQDPEAWLARYRYATIYRPNDKSSAADDDLNQAIALCSAAPPNKQVDIWLAAAERARRSSSLDQARDFLRRAIKAEPAAILPYLTLADIERQEGGESGIRKAIEVLLSGQKAANNRPIELTLALAQCLAAVGEDAELDRTLARLRSLLPQVGNTTTRGQIALGMATADSIRLLHRGLNSSAVAVLRAAIESPDVVFLAAGSDNGQLIKSWQLLAQLYTSLGSADQALEAYRQLVSLSPDSLDMHVALADAALTAGDLATALTQNLYRVKREPESGDAWVALAVTQLQQQLQLPPARRNLSDPVRSLARAWKLPAAKTPRLLASVDLLRAQGRGQEATKLLETALQQDVEQPRLWTALAILHKEQGDYEGALAAARQLGSHGGDILDTAALQSSVLVDAGRGQEAYQLLEGLRLGQSGSKQVKAVLLIAELERRLGRAERAYSLLEAAHRDHRSDTVIIEQLARDAWEDRDWKKLAHWEQELRQLEGDNGTVWKAYRATQLLTKEETTNKATLDEATQLLQEISASRPRWKMNQYLLAMLALRRGDSNEAVRRLETAWQLGDRSVAVAEPLLSLLHSMGRREEAKQFGLELGDVSLSSPLLFDRLLPLLFQQGQSKQALTQARQWVKDNPHDAQAFLRLGRASLIQASLLSDEAKRSEQLKEADKAFRQSVQLAPKDATNWSSYLAFYLQTDQRDSAVKLLDEFERTAAVDPIEKELVLARYNSLLTRPAQALKHWRTVARLSAEDSDSTKRASTLCHVASQFSPTNPKLAEQYVRQALDADPKNSASVFYLVRLLGARSEPTATAEAMKLLDQMTDESPAVVDERVRLKARLLAQRKGKGDADQAIQLLENLTTKEPNDKLLLAELYGHAGQVGRGYELLESLVVVQEPRASDLVAFISFWQEHFQEKGQFAGRAAEVLTRLGELPERLPERLRWELRIARAAAKEHSLSDSVAAQVLGQFWKLPAVNRLLAKESTRQSLMVGVLRMMVEEGHLKHAIDVCHQPPNNISAVYAARLLANTLMIQGLSDIGDIATVEAYLDKALMANLKDILLLQDCGDLAALCGRNDRAREMYERVLAIDPHHQAARNNLAAVLCQDAARRQESLKIVDQGLVDSPGAATLLSTKAAVFLAMGRTREAVDVLVSIADKQPPNPTAYLYLAQAHDRLNARSDAADALTLAAMLKIDQTPLPPSDRQALHDLREKYHL